MNQIHSDFPFHDLADSPSWAGMVSSLLLLGGALTLMLLVNPRLKQRAMQYGMCEVVCFLFGMFGLSVFGNLLAYALIIVTTATIIYHTIRSVRESLTVPRKILPVSSGIAAILLCYLAFAFYAGTVAFYPAGTYREESKRQLIVLSAVLMAKVDSWEKEGKSLALPDLSSLNLDELSLSKSFQASGMYEGYQYSIIGSGNPDGFCINAVPTEERGWWPSFRAEIPDASLRWSWWDMYCRIQYAYREGAPAPPDARYVCKKDILDLFVRDLGPKHGSRFSAHRHGLRLRQPEPVDSRGDV